MLKGKRNVDLVKLHKSGGIVSRNMKVRQMVRGLRIRVNWSFAIYSLVLPLRLLKLYLVL